MKVTDKLQIDLSYVLERKLSTFFSIDCITGAFVVNFRLISINKFLCVSHKQSPLETQFSQITSNSPPAARSNRSPDQTSTSQAFPSEATENKPQTQACSIPHPKMPLPSPPGEKKKRKSREEFLPSRWLLRTEKKRTNSNPETTTTTTILQQKMESMVCHRAAITWGKPTSDDWMALESRKTWTFSSSSVLFFYCGAAQSRTYVRKLRAQQPATSNGAARLETFVDPLEKG